MKVKILKKPKKSKKTNKANTTSSVSNKKTTPIQQTSVAQKYLAFYDDIKIPSQKYDW